MDDAETSGSGMGPEQPPLHLWLDATPKASSELRRALRGWLSDVGVSERDAFDVTLACSEAFANAVGGRPGLRAAVVEVRATVDARRVLTIVVRDHARHGFDRSREETRAFLRLMEALTESAETHARSDGSTLVLRKRLGLRRALPAG
jgi:anti-sigma regulatory factor (Ser/Thr protein kinase)